LLGFLAILLSIFCCILLWEGVIFLFTPLLLVLSGVNLFSGRVAAV